MVKEKVTLGNERVSQEMAGWNAFSIWPTYMIVSHICFQSQVFIFCVKSYVQLSVII